ncbi:DUF3601 domain-containing protein [Chryseobacterium sp. CT-SW4]|uniref:DUF3601 domain-containing protein n=1 Tax=Chryseobacterium sp. SW-1 TaxID=3157343 RepID=UPI003B020920
MKALLGVLLAMALIAVIFFLLSRLNMFLSSLDAYKNVSKKLVQLDSTQPEIGTWDNSNVSNVGKKYLFLEKGSRYRVIKSFSDYDSSIHKVGEEWTFLGYDMVPYHDGLSLYVSSDMKDESQIQMWPGSEKQRSVINNFHEYVELVE